MEMMSIASPLLKCVLPNAPDVDTRFQQDMFASKHTFADQPRLTEQAFRIAKRFGARIIRVFSYWRTVDPDKCSMRSRERYPIWRTRREGGPDHRSGERARLQSRNGGGDGARSAGGESSESETGVGSCECPGRAARVRFPTVTT